MIDDQMILQAALADDSPFAGLPKADIEMGVLLANTIQTASWDLALEIAPRVSDAFLAASAHGPHDALSAALFARAGDLVAALAPRFPLDRVDDNGDTHLLLASTYFGDAIPLLLPRSDPKHANSDGMTALMNAAASRAPNAVRLLIPVSDVEARDSNGMTALMWAAGEGEPELAEILPHADALATDKEGMTALMHAANAGRPGCVAMLIPVSDVLARETVKGFTALDFATKMHPLRRQTINALSEAMASAERAELALAVAPTSGELPAPRKGPRAL